MSDRSGPRTHAQVHDHAAPPDRSKLNPSPSRQDDSLERELRRKVDLRLCTIAGILCSLNLLDSGIIGSASVTSMISDLDSKGDRYSVSIFIFTISSIAVQLPSTLLVRLVGPRIWLSFATTTFGLVTMCTAFVSGWQSMIGVRILLGLATSGIYPGISYMISSWYPRHEQQLKFAFLQSAEVIVLATGDIVNFGLSKLGWKSGLAEWQWMFLVQGVISIFVGLISYLWMVDFPDKAERSFHFLTQAEQSLALKRIEVDRGDARPEPLTPAVLLRHAGDIKMYGFGCILFLQNLVSTALSYFLPIILQDGMGFDAGSSILLSAPPYYWAVVPALLSSFIADKLGTRGPIIVFNCMCLIVGFCMLGFARQVAVRYVGVYLATGAYVSNWAAVTAYYQNNVTGNWKRALTAATVTAMNGAGGIAGSFIVRANEPPNYPTAVWVSIGSHILMIGFVAAFSVHFARANARSAKHGAAILEGKESFRYTL